MTDEEIKEYWRTAYCNEKHKKEELEKENAELKEYNKYLKRKRQGGIQKQYNKVAIIKQQKEQLTKAKEIIKTFCGFCSVFNSTNGSLDNLIAEAERFLSEE